MERDQELVTPFDKLTSSKPIRMMKLMIPYVAPKMQQILAVYVRFLEFQDTLQFFRHFQTGLHSQDFANPTEPMDLFRELSPYLPASFSDTLEQFDSLKSMMDAMSEMADMTEGELNPMDLYGAMFSNQTNNPKEGENDEKMDGASSLSDP